MGESDPAGSVVTATTKEVHSNSSPQGKKKPPLQTRPGRFTFVDSIKEGFRKISNYKDSAKRKETVVQRQSVVISPEKRRAGGIVLGAKRKGGRGPSGELEVGHSNKRKTSFEMFLTTLPKCDPVARTEGWLYQQPVEWTKDPVFKTLTSLPQRGRIVPLPQPPMTRVSTVGYETSISYCESERGTHGRGTPPPIDMGQPRLDDLFRQLHVKQEHQARKEMGRQGETHLSSRNLRDIESAQVIGYPPGVTSELLPFLSSTGYYRAEPPSILHKNSFYYNQAVRQDTFQDTRCCEWGNCSVRFSSSKELLEHMQNEHISVLPLYHSKYKVHSSRGHQLICRWRDCFEVFDARYKLFLHIQTSHFKQHKTTTTPKMENEYCSPQEHKYATHPLRKPPTTTTTKCYPTHERSSLHVISIPFPDVSSRQTVQHSKKKHYRSVLHPLQPDRTQNRDNYKPGR